jgi:hypothetical protein
MSEPIKRICQNCRSWHAPLKAQDIGIGECRAGLPISSFTWPRTRAEQGCECFSPISDAGAGTTSPPVPVTGSEHENVAGAKSEASTGQAGPAFARGRSGPRLRR